MKRNLFLIVAIFLGLVVTMLLGNLITIGDKMGQLTHVYVEYAFYIIILVLVLIYVIRPILKVHRAPEFPILAVNEEWDANQLYVFAKQLAKNCDYISNTEKRKNHQNELIHNIQTHSAKVDELRAVIVEEVALRMDGNKEMNVLGINNRIKEWGKTVFMVTAISQNSKFDSIAVLVMNYKLISDIVIATGFRPTRPQLFKLYIQVLTTALITYCTSQVLTDVDGVTPFDFGDDVDIDELDTDIDVDIDVNDIDVDEGGFGSSIMEKLKKLTIPGILIGSAIEGCINALMTMRIGYVTRAYLTEGSQALSGIKNKRKIKRQAIKNAFKSMPNVIASSSTAIGKTAASVLKGLFDGEKDVR